MGRSEAVIKTNLKRLLATQLIKRANMNVKKGGLLYKLGTQFLIDYKFPIHLYLELSRECNLSCKMCRRVPAKNKHMSLEMAKGIIEEAAKYGPTSYSMHLFGEPLMSPHYHEIAKMIRKANKHNAIILTTNGYFLDSQHDADVIFVSMPEFNYAVLDNTLITNHKLIVRTFDTKTTKEVEKLGLPVQQRQVHNFTDPEHPMTEYKKKDRYPCWHPWYTLGITVDGDVTVCCADYKLGTKVGDLKRDSLTHIWQGVGIMFLRIGHLKDKYVPWDSCEGCDVWQFKPNIFFRRQYD